MLDDTFEQDGQQKGVTIKDLPQTPEGAYSAGKVIKVIVAGTDGKIDIVFFKNQEVAKQYLEKYYKGATPSTNTTYLALDSLDPAMSLNQYSMLETDVWTTTKPDTRKQTEYVGKEVVTAFVDNNGKEAQPFQRSLKQQTTIGVWTNSDEATAFYKKSQPDKIIRDNKVYGNAATVNNLVKPNEIYLQHRVIINK